MEFSFDPSVVELLMKATKKQRRVDKYGNDDILNCMVCRLDIKALEGTHMSITLFGIRNGRQNGHETK